MKFSDIPGHNAVKRRLRMMAQSGKMPHAIMLAGPSGVGKFALARALAQFLHCSSPTPEGDSCGTCPSCLQHQSLNHIDTIYSFPVIKRDGGKETLSTDYFDEWREYLVKRVAMDYDRWSDLLNGASKSAKQPLIPRDEAREILRRVATTAHAAGHKFVIIWLPERMNEAAANALLKVIEEPFADTSFILVSDDPESVIGTIRSRCQTVHVGTLPEQEIALWLSEKSGIPQNEAAVAAGIARGSLAEAVRQAETAGDASEMLDRFIQLMRMAYMRDVAGLRVWANSLAALGREAQVRFYHYCQRLIRENFIFNFNRTSLVSLNSAEAQFSQRFARFINERNVERLMEAMNSARIDIEGNGNGKIINFDLAIRVILMLK